MPDRRRGTERAPRWRFPAPCSFPTRSPTIRPSSAIQLTAFPTTTSSATIVRSVGSGLLRIRAQWAANTSASRAGAAGIRKLSSSACQAKKSGRSPSSTARRDTIGADIPLTAGSRGSTRSGTAASRRRPGRARRTGRRRSATPAPAPPPRGRRSSCGSEQARRASARSTSWTWLKVACSTGPNRPLSSIGSTAPSRAPDYPHHRIAQLTHQRIALVPDVPDERDVAAGPQHPCDLEQRRAVVEPVECLRHRDHIGAFRRKRDRLCSSRRAVASGTAARSWSSISGSGSTAVTRWPRSTSVRVSLPVPAPRSTTSHGFSPDSQRTASTGYPGRERSYTSATPPNEAARSRRSFVPALMAPG